MVLTTYTNILAATDRSRFINSVKPFLEGARFRQHPLSKATARSHFSGGKTFMKRAICCTLKPIFLTVLLIKLVDGNLEAQAKKQVSDVPQLTVIASKSIIVNTAEPIERVSVTDSAIAEPIPIS